MATKPLAAGEVPDKTALLAAFDWWREAGVDCDFAEAPTAWLRAEESEAAVTSPPVPVPRQPARETALERALGHAGAGARIGGDEADWPRDLPAFREWWLHEKSLSDAPAERRQPPVGDSNADLAVLTAFPLAQGEEAFLAAILRATGMQDDGVYRASAVPASLGLPDWVEMAERGLAAVTRHHLGLVKPRRVLVFDRGLAPLFGIASGEARSPAVLDLAGGRVSVLLVPALADLARTPARRQTFWNHWLEWTA